MMPSTFQEIHSYLPVVGGAVVVDDVKPGVVPTEKIRYYYSFGEKICFEYFIDVRVFNFSHICFLC